MATVLVRVCYVRTGFRAVRVLREKPAAAASQLTSRDRERERAKAGSEWRGTTATARASLRRKLCALNTSRPAFCTPPTYLPTSVRRIFFFALLSVCFSLRLASSYAASPRARLTFPSPSRLLLLLPPAVAAIFPRVALFDVRRRRPEIKLAREKRGRVSRDGARGSAREARPAVSCRRRDVARLRAAECSDSSAPRVPPR